MKKVLLTILFLMTLAISGCRTTEINLASLSYGDMNIEHQANQEVMYITTSQLGSLLEELGIKFEDYTSGIHVLPHEQQSLDIPREYDLYGYWVAVTEEGLFGFQFQSSVEWGAYTVVVMHYDATVDLASDTFDINELKSVRVGSYHIRQDSSIALVFEGLTQDFETPFSAYDEIEIWEIKRNGSGFTFSNEVDEILLSPVDEVPFME